MQTLSNFIKTVLLAASLLLLGGCGNGKTQTEQTSNTSTIIDETDDNATAGNGNGENPTGGSNDGEDNTTIPPTTTITSLTLTIGKTSLNKDESSTVKVMAAYSDNSTKEVTDKVEWILTPGGTVKMTNTTLTALKDIQTTIQAKLGNVLSEVIDLSIYWEVNGHRLPPEPDKTLNDSTLLGIDANDNGVGDDVERWI